MTVYSAVRIQCEPVLAKHPFIVNRAAGTRGREDQPAVLEDLEGLVHPNHAEGPHPTEKGCTVDALQAQNAGMRALRVGAPVTNGLTEILAALKKLGDAPAAE